jgi:DNA-binding transcriptional LysR family regulator
VVSVSGPLIVNDVELLIRAALDGVGLAFTLEEHVAAHLAKGRLVRVLLDWCPPFEGYFLYYPASRHQRPALQALIAALRARQSMAVQALAAGRLSSPPAIAASRPRPPRRSGP